MVEIMKAAARGKRAVNVTINDMLIEDAKKLKINVSQAAEAGIEAAVSRARQERWKEENRATMDDWNTWVEQHGLPLAEHRKF